MCGIAGVLHSKATLSNDQLRDVVKKMGGSLTHRGPDDSGEWVDEQSGIALGHQRLSILDLSQAGHQPMISNNQRFVLSYNGEIYNFNEIRMNLENAGVKFRGHSDSEVLLESIAHFGFEKTLPMLNGMFAFALWDREECSLILTRDRVGKKPLYYGYCNGAFLFGSELKSLRVHPNFDAEIDRAALGQFIQFSWLNGPSTIYKHIKKLNPGSYLKMTRANLAGYYNPQKYWSMKKIAEYGSSNPYSNSYLESVDELDKLLRESVALRMTADVELGALLSGGIDSSLVVSMMQSQSTKKIKTFSIGFYESSHNEAEFAKKIAQHLGTDHAELYVTPKECMDVIPKLPEIYDEPLGDASQIPTFLVSKLVSRKTKVVLSGDGGDELFAGYSHYFRCLKHWERQKTIPPALRPFAATMLSALANLFWIFFCQKQTIYSNRGWKSIGEKLEKRSNRINAVSSQELFMQMLKKHNNIEQLVCGSQNNNSMYSDKSVQLNDPEPLLNMMFMDMVCYLPDDILVKLDRASMASSLEARCPLLDARIIEFAWRLPITAKINENGGKRILRDVLARYIPKTLTERKKMGFGVPVGKWLRGPLKEWAEELIDPVKLKNQSYLNSTDVRKLWDQHQSGWRNRDDVLWSILMFLAWHQRFG